MTETTELATYQDQGNAIAHRSESANIIATILDAARDPSVDAAKVETMANLAMKLQDREQEVQFNRDLNAALSEMPVITKAGIIVIPARDGKPERTQGRYARFEDIDRVVRPILMRHNLAIRFEVGEKDQNITVRPILSHANGHTERGEGMRLPLDTSGSKNNVQGAGSAVSYGKRYTMCALLNIITEGTDGDGSLGKLPINMPMEREVAVLDQAEEAAAHGQYADWFKRQSVKDRAWLVDSGNHARFGGAPADPAIPAPAAKPASAQPEKPKHDVTTPDGWTAQYEEDAGNARSIAELMTVVQRGARGLERLKTGHPALHKRATEAEAAAHKRLDGDDAE